MEDLGFFPSSPSVSVPNYKFLVVLGMCDPGGHPTLSLLTKAPGQMGSETLLPLLPKSRSEVWGYNSFSQKKP